MANRAKAELGGRQSKSDRGIGTPIAEYAESGPYHCDDCKFLKSPGTPDAKHGLCPEPHVLRDMEAGRIKQHKPSRLAIVDLERGCCRFIQIARGKHEDKS